MKRMLSTCLLALGMISMSSLTVASAELWQEQGYIDPSQLAQRGTWGSTLDLSHSPLHSYRALSVNEQALRQTLDTATRNAAFAARSATDAGYVTTVSLPLPDGRFTSLKLTQTNTLAPAIALQFPEIQTWKVEGTDGLVNSGVLDFTSTGFRAMLVLNDGDTVFIDPLSAGEAASQTVNQTHHVLYASFSQRSNAPVSRKAWSCGAAGHSHEPTSATPVFANRFELAQRTLSTPATSQAITHLHTYRLAIAATAEYTRKQGDNALAGFNAIVTTINRVNQIYERDLGIRLQLVSDTRTVYTDPETDPYNNDSLAALILQNQTHLDSVLGNANYDIGHVFSTATGGRAYVGVTCNDRYKASAATGLTNPMGETFDISYVAHEIAHQLGALHSFNSQQNSCMGHNRDGDSAVEPGSGSTIMSYAGICGSDNLQTTADAMFHSSSIEQIKRFAHYGLGASCATRTRLDNRAPVLTVSESFTIPAQTPFRLQGSAIDADGDILSYSWEQMDSGTASDIMTDNGDNALIRSYLPSTEPVRYVPRLNNLLNGASTNGELLPKRSRQLNFRFNVRDGKTVAHADTVINVVNTGKAFQIKDTGYAHWTPTSFQTIAWEVADTDQAPINCHAVDIDLTINKGHSFIRLASVQPNTGSAVVQLPQNLGRSHHVRVQCNNNIFFALSHDYAIAARQDPSSQPTETANINIPPAANASSSTSGAGGGGSSPLFILLTLAVLSLMRTGIRLFSRSARKVVSVLN